MNRLYATLAATGLSGAAVLAGPANSAFANVQGSRWSAAATTLNSGFSSNEVGFWQQLLFSMAPCFGPLDGIYGTLTKNTTKDFQQNLLHYTGAQVDGIVGWRTWDDTQYASYERVGHTYKRLSASGGGHYDYYGGSAYSDDFYWGGGAADIWKFAADSNQGTSPNIQATYTRTMGSWSCP